MEARIIVARCNSKKPYGIRIEKKGNDWIRTWAFPLSEEMILKEHYVDEAHISGTLTADKEYPGCPYCKAEHFAICGSCHHMSCYNPYQSDVICNWCGKKLSVRIAETFDINSTTM